MNISAWAINRPIPVLVLFLVLTIGGWMGFRGMTVQNLPDFDLPVVTVKAAMLGATATNMETEVAKKLEDAFAGIDKLEHITTTVTEGSAAVTLQFLLEKDVQEAVDDVKDAIAQVKADLPADVEEPVVRKKNISGAPLISYALSSKALNTKQLSWFVDNEVSRALMAVNGVGQVSRRGGVDRQVNVVLDRTQMASYGVTAAGVSKQLRQKTQDASGGRTSLAGQEQTVRTVGALASIDELAGYPLSLVRGGQVRLDELATIEDGAAEQRTKAWVDGKEVVSFQVYKSKGTSEVEVGDAVRAAVDKLHAQHPELEVQEIFNDIESVRSQYDASMRALWEGAALAVVVVMFFLRNARATFVSGMALPLSVIPTFFAMYLFGFSLNTVTLLALTLVVGILVDDAIVEVEQVVRHQQMGKRPLEAARDAAAEIGLAVVATSMTLVAVFLPTAFMSGIPGKFFKQFGWTASLAVLMSLMVARLLTPLMAARFMKPVKGHPVEGEAWHKKYMRALDLSLRRPWRVMAAALVFFLGSLFLLGKLPAGFVPKTSTGQVTVSVELAPGVTLNETAKVLELARERIKGVPGVERVYAIAGTGADVRKGSMNIQLAKSVKDETQAEKQVRAAVADIPGAKFGYGRGGSGESLSIVLTGEDPKGLAEATKAIEADLRAVPGMGNVNSSASLLKPELVVTPDLQKAAAFGVTPSSIGETVKVATVGDVDRSLPKLNEGLRQIPVRVSLADSERLDKSSIEALRVPSSTGQVLLSNVAEVTLASGPAEINRYDRSRNVTITAELAGLPLGEVVAKVNDFPSMKNLPTGVSRQASGDMERMMELFTSFGMAMALGVLAVYLVLVLLFHDFVQPVTILMALPLSIGGAVLALMVGNYSLSMPALIGLLMLMGIVAKNSILLVEYAARMQRTTGCSSIHAMEDACAKRVRPILMTTVAMGAGMLPIALATSGDSSFRAPMAAAVIGGLLTSTLLSLFVVPAFYVLVDRLERAISLRRFSRARRRVKARKG